MSPAEAAAQRTAKTLESFDRLPDAAHVRAPVVAALRATSLATVWRHARAGLIPPPRKVGAGTVWNVGELRAAMKSGAGA